MVRLILAVMIFATSAAPSYTQPSLPSSYQSKTISSPEGVDIFVRWAGKGPVVVLIHGYAENSPSSYLTFVESAARQNRQMATIRRRRRRT